MGTAYELRTSPSPDNVQINKAFRLDPPFEHITQDEEGVPIAALTEYVVIANLFGVVTAYPGIARRLFGIDSVRLAPSYAPVASLEGKHRIRHLLTVMGYGKVIDLAGRVTTAIPDSEAK
jgi:hypothetical protein